VMFDIGAHTQVVACRGTGGTSCVLEVAIQNGTPGVAAEAP
jgi:hypothetical protein